MIAQLQLVVCKIFIKSETACGPSAHSKSLREGFGLVVSEALWKEVPVVAGNAGGIPLQMTGELSNYLVNNVEECAEKIVYLLENPQVGQRLGKLGKEIVTQNFLSVRLARDELRLIKSLV